MTDYDLKTITPEASFTDGNVLFGADNQGAATPAPYTSAAIKTWFQSTGAPGSDTQLLYNNGGAIAGLASATYDGFYLTLGNILPATVNGMTLSGGSAFFTVGVGKAVTISNSLTFSGTDSSTLNIGGGGTLGTAAFVNTGTSGATIPILNGNNTESGNNTYSGTSTITANGALSSGAGPAWKATGTWIASGGNATTTKPYVLIETSGATSTLWNTAGTGLAVNAASGFTGDLINLQTNGAVEFKVSAAGAATVNNTLTISNGNVISSNGGFQISSLGTASWASRGIISSPATGSIQIGTTDNAAGASVVAQTLRAQSVAAGGTNNQNAQNWTIIGSLSTGTGTNGDIIFQTGATGVSGSAQNTATTTLTLKGGSTQINTAGNFLVGNNLTVGASAAVGQFAAYSWTSGNGFISPSTTSIQIGLFDQDTSAAIGAQTFRSQGLSAGGTADQAGKNFTILASPGKGTGAGGSILLQTTSAGTTGTAINPAVTGLTIKTGTAVLTNYLVANLPSASVAGAGATAFVTDASTTIILGLGGTVAGGGANKTPVYSDGTNWIIG